MFNSPIIDIAIGLSFLYFLLGLLASSVNEMIFTFLKTRPKYLKGAILNFLHSDWKTIGQEIVESPYIKSLSKNEASFPSYIPSEAFSQAVIDIIKGTDELPQTVEDIRAKIKGNPIFKGETEKWLLGMLDQSFGKIDQFYKQLENSYLQAMKRVTGWYARKAKRTVLIIGVVISVGLNIDTIAITQYLWKSPTQAKAFADLAVQEYENYNKDGAIIINIGDSTKYNTNLDTAKTVSDKDLKSIKEKIQTIQTEVSALPIPLGWNTQTTSQKNGMMAYASMAMGWLITAMAIYLGAPFWFDLLGKIVNIRGSGSKPKTPKTP